MGLALTACIKTNCLAITLSLKHVDRRLRFVSGNRYKEEVTHLVPRALDRLEFWLLHEMVVQRCVLYLVLHQGKKRLGGQHLVVTFQDIEKSVREHRIAL